MARVINGSGQVTTEVDVKTADGDLILSTAPPNRNMVVTGGTITTDDSRDIPGDGTIEILADPATRDDVMPTGPRSALSPVNNAVVHVRYTCADADAPTLYGVYDIAETVVDEGPDGIRFTCTIYDNARRVERAKFVRPRSYPNGSDYDAAFVDLLVSILPFSDIDVVPTGATVGLLSWDVGDSRLRAVQDMALMVGYRVNWNYGGAGNVLVGPRTQPSAEPVWTFTEGGNARITKANRRLSDDAAYNGVIVSGEASGSDTPPVRAEVWDTDPRSPTYYDPARPTESSYGANPYFHVSPFAYNATQAKAIAASLLPQWMGLVERLQIEAVVNPAVEVSDAIQVERPEIGASGTYIVESTSIPLASSAGRMTIACRERRLIDGIN